MFPGNQNPFLQIPGKVILDIHRGRMPSGQIVEIMIAEENFIKNGLLCKQKVHEIKPGTADGTTPTTVDEIRECYICLGLFRKTNVRRCSKCGREYCCLKECGGDIQLSEGVQVSVCVICAKEANTSVFERFFKRFWGLGT